jgi:hypothetical protein
VTSFFVARIRVTGGHGIGPNIPEIGRPAKDCGAPRNDEKMLCSESLSVP